MHRSKFKNCLDKCGTYENWCTYKIQQNYCANLLRNILKISKLSDITTKKDLAEP